MVYWKIKTALKKCKIDPRTIRNVAENHQSMPTITLLKNMGYFCNLTLGSFILGDLYMLATFWTNFLGL